MIDLRKQTTSKGKASLLSKLQASMRKRLDNILKMQQTIKQAQSTIAPKQPIKPIQKEPIKPIQKEPTKPVQNEPIKPIQKEPTKPIQKEPTKPISKEPS